MFQTFVGKQEEGVCPGFVWQLGRLHKPLLNRRICINCSLDDLLSDPLVIMLIRFPSLPSPSFCPVAQFSFHSSSLNLVIKRPRKPWNWQTCRTKQQSSTTTITTTITIIRLIDGEEFIRVSRVMEWPQLNLDLQVLGLTFPRSSGHGDSLFTALVISRGTSSSGAGFHPQDTRFPSRGLHAPRNNNPACSARREGKHSAGSQRLILWIRHGV